MNRTLSLMIRSLRVNSRELVPHLFRLALGSGLLTVLYFWQSGKDFSASPQPGRDFFLCVMWVNAIFVTLAGVTLFSTCITEEKEEQTLPLLLMANVGGLAILFGKFIPQLLGAILLLTVQIPFVYLAITMGGVAAAEIGDAFLGLFSHLVWVGSLGLFASVVSQRTNSALRLAAILILTYLFGPWLLGEVLNGFKLPGTVQLPWIGPVENLLKAWSSTFFVPDSLASTKNQLVGQLGGSLILFVLSAMIFRRFAIDRADRPTRQGLFKKLAPPQRRSGRAPDAPFPLVWKDFFFAAGGYRGWIIQFFLYSAVAGIVMWLNFDSTKSLLDAPRFGEFLFITIVAIGFIQIGVLTSRMFQTEIRDQTWSTLAMLPEGLVGICYAKLVGQLVSVLPMLVFLIVSLSYSGVGMIDGELVSVIAYIASQAILIYHVAILISVSFRGYWPVALFSAFFGVIFGNIFYLFVFEIMFSMHSNHIYILYGAMIPTLGSFPIIQHLIGQRLLLEAQR